MSKFRVWDSKRKEWMKNVDIIMDNSGRFWAGDVFNPPMLHIESKNVFFSTDVSDRSGKTIFDNSIVTWEIDNGAENKVYKGTVLWSENTVAFKGSFRWIVKYERDGPSWALDREEGTFDYFSTVYTYKDSILVVGSVQEDL